jgi:hypothetical protein
LAEPKRILWQSEWPLLDRNEIVAEHCRRNATTVEAREFFAQHRHRLMQLLLKLQRNPSDRLCLLGAGNCNDIDLPRLTQCFQQITLVDLDPAACHAAVERQAQSADQLAELKKHIHISNSTDVTGLLEVFDSGKQTGQSPSEIAAWLLQRLQDSRPSMGHLAYDCVSSCCLLSQLVDSIAMGLGSQTERFMQVILTMRRQHLLAMIHCLVPGGRGLIVLDFVSTQTLPQLSSADEHDLPRTLLAAVEAQNFFTGLNPFAIHAELLRDSGLSHLVDHVQLSKPWLWKIPMKTFAVCAISFVKR